MNSNQKTSNLEHDDGTLSEDEIDRMPDLEHDDMFPNYNGLGLDEMPDYVCMHHEITTKHDDGIDRISDMPDYILCEILSCLPTKYAIAAKLLSTRWKTLFPSFFWVPPVVIDIDDSLFFTIKNTSNHNLELRRDIHNFTDLLLRETMPRLDILKIKCITCGDNMKIEWIRAALKLNVQDLSFTSYLCESENLFRILNGYTAVTRLKLHLEYTDIYTPDDFVLKTMVLCNVRIYFGDEEHEDFLSNLMNGCPALEDLRLTSCILRSYDNNDLSFSLSIQCPRLKNLTIEECDGIWFCNLEIDTPNLKLLLWKGHASARYNVTHFKSLILADIDAEFSWLATGVEEFHNACSNVVHLNLSAYVIDALCGTLAELLMFKNLNRLKLGYIQLHGWAILTRILCSSPNLQTITFKQGFCLHDGGYLIFESLVLIRPPICLEQNLKEIEFCVFDGRKDEINLVEYFLTNGKVIETIKLHCIPFKKKSNMWWRLCMLPRHSQLSFQFR